MVAIASMIKNEHLYLEEWINYHLELGIDYIFLFEDWDSKSHSEITNKYNNVFITNISLVINSEDRMNIQIKVANYFATLFQLDFEWIGFIDADEYITISNNKTLKEILSNYLDNILLKWENYNSNGHFYRPEGSILSNYKQTCKYFEKDSNIWVYKSFAYTKNYPEWINVHYVDKYVHLDEIYIRHYVTKSFEDYCIRVFERGDVCERVYRKYEAFFELNPEFDRSKCDLFVLEKYGSLQEVTGHIKNPIQINTSKSIISTIYKYIDLNLQILEFNSITGTIEVLDDYEIVGGIKLVNNKLIVFIHNSRHSNNLKCKILVTNSKGYSLEFVIELEGNNKDLELNISEINIPKKISGNFKIKYSKPSDINILFVNNEIYSIEDFKYYIILHFKLDSNNCTLYINDCELKINRI